MTPNRRGSLGRPKAKGSRPAEGKGGGRRSHTTTATKTGKRMMSEPPLSHQRKIGKKRYWNKTEERLDLKIPLQNKTSQT